MTIEPLVSILIALFLIAIREGLVIADMQDNTYKSKILSGWWHKMGMVIRGFLILAIFLLVQEHHGYSSWIFWGYVAASFLLSSLWYNIAINLITGKKWYYLSDKGIDGFIKRLLKLKS